MSSTTGGGAGKSKRAQRRAAWAEAARLARQAANRGTVVDTSALRSGWAGQAEQQGSGSGGGVSAYGVSAYGGSGGAVRRVYVSGHRPPHRRATAAYERQQAAAAEAAQQAAGGGAADAQQSSAEAPKRAVAPYKLGLKGEPALGAMHASWRVRRVAGARQHRVIAPCLAPPGNRKERRMVERRGVAVSLARCYLAFDDDGSVDEARSVRVNKVAARLEAEWAARAARKREKAKAGPRTRRKKRAREAQDASVANANDDGERDGGVGGDGPAAAGDASSVQVAGRRQGARHQRGFDGTVPPSRKRTRSHVSRASS